MQGEGRGKCFFRASNHRRSPAFPNDGGIAAKRGFARAGERVGWRGKSIDRGTFRNKNFFTAPKYREAGSRCEGRRVAKFLGRNLRNGWILRADSPVGWEFAAAPCRDAANHRTLPAEGKPSSNQRGANGRRRCGREAGRLRPDRENAASTPRRK